MPDPRYPVTEAPKYRIQAVSEMTGVPAATLRAWERRYGFPKPDRASSSAYRLYSDRDIHLIRRLQQLCEQGMAPSEAAKVVLADADVQPVPVSADRNAYDVARDRIVEATDGFSVKETEHWVRQAMVLGPALSVFERVFGPALAEIGDRWHLGEISVGQEHMASEIIGNAVRDMLRLVQPEKPEQQVLLACFAEEQHVLPLYGIGFRFAEWGWGSILLGQRTPPDALAHAVRELAPDVVGLSVTVTPDRKAARDLVEGYAKARADRPWVVGGAGAEPLRTLIENRGGLVVGSSSSPALRRLVQASAEKKAKKGMSR